MERQVDLNNEQFAHLMEIKSLIRQGFLTEFTTSKNSGNLLDPSLPIIGTPLIATEEEVVALWQQDTRQQLLQRIELLRLYLAEGIYYDPHTRVCIDEADFTQEKYINVVSFGVGKLILALTVDGCDDGTVEAYYSNICHRGRRKSIYNDKLTFSNYGGLVYEKYSPNLAPPKSEGLYIITPREGSISQELIQTVDYAESLLYLGRKKLHPIY